MNSPENAKLNTRSLRKIMNPKSSASTHSSEFKTQGELIYEAARLKSEIDKIPDTPENKIEKQKLLEKLGKILALLPADDTENKYYQR